MLHTPIKQDKLIDHQPMIQPGILVKKFIKRRDWYKNQLIENRN
jgi:hypothetical protein